MQVTTLNKIINLFLVGIFANTLLAIVCGYIIGRNITHENIALMKSATDSLGGPLIAVIATFILFSTSILAGIVVDALSNLLLRKLVKDTLKYKSLRYFLWCEDQYNLCETFFEKFKQQSLLVNKLKHINNNNEKKVDMALATAIFFHTANKENIEWAIQHYSFHLLSINYLLIICIETPVIFFLPFSISIKVFISIINIIFIYALVYQAVHKYLYTYETTYRHCAVALCDGLDSETLNSFKSS